MSARHRIDELLDAVRDVELPSSARPHQPLGNARPEHRVVFRTYLNELAAAKANADHWWQGLVQTELQRTGDPAVAKRNVFARRPHGPVVHPWVLRCIRRAWLDCQAVNDALPIQQGVSPDSLVLMWLEDANEHVLAEFVGDLPYWPVGQDEAGRWI
jgi:hypothetical protein